MKDINYDMITNNIRLAEFKFNRAAQAWVRGNNSGDSEELSNQERIAAKFHGNAEKLLRDLNMGITVTYPGLYPVYHMNDRDYYDANSLLTDALKVS